jgi:hypothetical protein
MILPGTLDVDKHEVVSMALALEEVARSEDMGEKGAKWMCWQAAKLIRRLRPDLSFCDEES